MESYPITMTFPLHWGELDALGHVNNTSYFRWFESVRLNAFIEIELVTTADSTCGPILASTTCNYLNPITWPAEILVGTRFSKIGRTSFTMEYAVALAGEPRNLCAEGSSVCVLINYQTGEKIPMDNDMRKTIERYGGGNKAGT